MEDLFFPLGSEEKLLQSADLAMLLTNSTANGGIGGQVDGVDPIRNPGIFWCAWSAKNFKGAFVHEIGHLFGARDKFYYHITQNEIRNDLFASMVLILYFVTLIQ